MRYSQLPVEPPAYDGNGNSDGRDDDNEDLFDLESRAGERISQDSLAREFEEMDIEDNQGSSSTFRSRARNAGDRIANEFNSKIKLPVQRILDPIAEGCAHLSKVYERYLAKLGNPLLVKRFGYVIFISLITYLLTYSGINPQGNGAKFGSFTDRSALERFLTESLDLKSMEENLEYLSSMDHVAGTTGDLTLARFVDTIFKVTDMNIVDLDEMRTLLSFPNMTSLAYDDIVLDLTEQANTLSFNGEVKGNLIYVNYARKSDFEKLLDNKIDLKNRIAIVKLSSKIPISQQVLISQTFEIGGLFFISETNEYPDLYERRSVGIPQLYTGDPLTPGWSTSVLTERVNIKDASTAKIPTVSISRTQAKPLLEKLSNKGIKFDDGFSSGDGASNEVIFNNRVLYEEDHSIWNVLGKIDGKEQGDQAIIIGAQRDSLCRGTIYPNSGTTILLEMAQLFTKLKLKFNWTPLRSIYFISFDAAEYNFAGVTELIEAKFHEVKKETIAYIDLSEAIAGDVLEVRSNSLLTEMVRGYQEEYNITMKPFDDYGNYIPFIMEGVPVLTAGYKGLNYPKYTCQDNFENFQKIGDGDFSKHARLVELVMKFTLKLIDDPLIPFDVFSYVEDLDHKLKDLQEYAKEKRSESNYDYRLLFEGLLKLKIIAKELDTWKKAWNDLVTEDGGVEQSLLSVHRWNWNSKLNSLEKLFLDPAGILGRQWYKNLIYGPQLFKPENDRYDWFSYPGIRDALDQFSNENVQEEINRVGQALLDGCNIFLH